jgi:hypothetical protein
MEKISDQMVFLISNYLKSEVDHDLTYFRDKALFDFNRSQIESFKGQNTYGALSGEMKDQKWTLNGLAVDYEKFESLLSSIAQMKAKDFPSPAPTFTAGQKILSYQMTEKRPSEKEAAKVHTLEVFEKAKKFYAKSSFRKEIVEIESNSRSTIDRNVNQLRSTIFFTQPDRIKVTSAIFQGKKFPKATTYKLDQDKWTEVKANSADPTQASTPPAIDAMKVGTILEILEKGRIKEFVKPAPPKTADRLNLILGSAENPKLFEFEFYKTKDHLYLLNPDPKRKGEALQLEDEMKPGIPL